MADIKTISTTELEERLRAGGPFEFWNVLTDEYFHGEMIPGSRRVPLDAVGREARQAGLPKDAEVIVYCAGPKCPQSGMAAEKFQALGYTNVRAYEGGLEEWRGTGHDVESVGSTVAA
ncbi:MAG TPA: rhodanese-like domain-containing protein [Pyrinomonadaceae bacterium]|jgi:rhodanese-related sulfurtransferase